ncbi:MAG TPA: hypothetical protein VFQ53_02130 [Kofleriaceae bacterium]|nr:hypothetical protein [Kofleriaceae bacterium]
MRCVAWLAVLAIGCAPLAKRPPVPKAASYGVLAAGIAAGLAAAYETYAALDAQGEAEHILYDLQHTAITNLTYVDARERRDTARSWAVGLGLASVLATADGGWLVYQHRMHDRIDQRRITISLLAGGAAVGVRF